MVVYKSLFEKAYSGLCIYAFFRLQTPINGQIFKIALGNIRVNKRNWHDCLLLVNARVIAKAITDQ